MKRNILNIAIGSLLLVGLIVVISQVFHHPKAPINNSPVTVPDTSSPAAQAPAAAIPTPSAQIVHDQLLPQISDSSLRAAGFSVDSVTQPSPGWVIARVTPTGTDQQSVLLQLANDGTLTLISGPTGQFTLSVLQANDVPEAVIQLLPTYVSDDE